MKHEIFSNVKYFQAIFLKETSAKMILSLLAIYRGLDSESSSTSNDSICDGILV